MRRRVIDTDVTPSGDPIELFYEDGTYVVQIDGLPLMSSFRYGSEQSMASVAAQQIGRRDRPRVLVGGLGMGFTLRAALDVFGPNARVTVAELLPAVVRYNYGELGALAQHPLTDPRVTLFQGDVRETLAREHWDVVLMDVDNGPEAFTVASNDDLYTSSGIQMLVESLTRGGVLVVWSAFRSRAFVRDVRKLGHTIEPRQVGTGASGDGAQHTLFVVQAGQRRS